jgi:nuclear pore complex protein Nup205
VQATISYYTSVLALLLRLSRTRAGATALLNAGLFPSIRASALFSTDPDIGLDVDNPDALKIFFEIMLAVIKIIVAVLMAREVGNEQMKGLVREFLSENRETVVAVFKRNAGIGYHTAAASAGKEGKDGAEKVLSELVDMYSLLISATGWLEVSSCSIFST